MLLEYSLLVLAVAFSLVALYLSISSRSKAKKAVALVRATLSSGKTKLAKPRRRYLVFEVVTISGDLSRIKKNHVEEAVQKSCQLLYGIVGYGAIRPSLVYYDESRGVGVLTFKHMWRNHVFLLLSLIREIGGVKVLVVPVATTGTRKKAMSTVKRV